MMLRKPYRYFPYSVSFIFIQMSLNVYFMCENVFTEKLIVKL
jgi:hypothetical protein